MGTGAGTKEAIVIAGPTATGKSELAVELAERVDGAIISADSRQVYRHMDIGTAKPRPELRERVPHYGLDLLEPTERYSAGRFARDARGWISEIRERGRVPVIAGGTGLFIRALLAPLAPEPEMDPERRRRLRRYLAGLATPVLKRWLRRLDARRAADLQEEGGSQRLARSLEVTLLSGVPHSDWLGRPPEVEPLRARVYRLDLPRAELYARVDRRFDRMMRAGLLDEVRGLLDRHPAASPGLRTMGYAELVRALREEVPLSRAVEAAKRRTRRYAKRQLTWFRHQLPDATVVLDARRAPADLADEIAG